MSSRHAHKRFCGDAKTGLKDGQVCFLDMGVREKKSEEQERGSGSIVLRA